MAASAACVLAHAGSSGWNNATVTGNVVHPTLIRIEEHAMKLMLMKIDLVTHARVPRAVTDKQVGAHLDLMENVLMKMLQWIMI